MHLKMKKLTSRWVPHKLTEKNRNDRVRMCEENLAKFKEGKWRLSDVVTGDESWFYHRQILKKQSNMIQDIRCCAHFTFKLVFTFLFLIVIIY